MGRKSRKNGWRPDPALIDGGAVDREHDALDATPLSLLTTGRGLKDRRDHFRFFRTDYDNKLEHRDQETELSSRNEALKDGVI